MNFRQLEAFRAVMLSRSMTVAAGLLHTSQPNVSRWIGLLEETLGFELFKRTATRLIPTPEAEAFYAEVERSFTGLEALDECAHTIRTKGTRAIRVGAVGSLTECILPEAIRRFKESYADAPVIINTGKSDQVAKWTASGLCDLGFCSIETDSPGLAFELVNAAQGVVVVHEDHRLAGRPLLKPADLQGENFISLPAGGINRVAVDKWFRTIPRTLSVESVFATTICSLVGKGVGVSILNPIVVRAMNLPTVREIPFSEKVTFQSFVVRSDPLPTSVLARHLEACVKQVFRQLNSAQAAAHPG